MVRFHTLYGKLWSRKKLNHVLCHGLLDEVALGHETVDENELYGIIKNASPPPTPPPPSSSQHQACALDAWWFMLALYKLKVCHQLRRTRVRMKLSFLTLAIGAEVSWLNKTTPYKFNQAFLRCPRTRPVDCESCGKFSFKCKQSLHIRKDCAQFCRLEDMNCPLGSVMPASCDACNETDIPCQRRLGYRQQCRDLCNPPVFCTMMVPQSCDDCRKLSVPCRQPHKTMCNTFCQK